MKLDASIGFATDLKDVSALAQAAETIGFDAIWTSETQHDPFLPLTLAAVQTSRLKFGTAVTIAFARSPLVVAHTAWDLAKQSDGRFMLGLGTQVQAHIERRFGMTWTPPVPRLREYVQAIRAVWTAWQTGGKLNFRGSEYKLSLMTPFFSPGPIDHPTVPIFIAGVGTPLCRLAGEVADGFHVHAYHTRKYLSDVVLPAIAEGVRKADRKREAIEIATMAFVALSEDEITAQRQQVAFYASTPSYRPVLDLHGWGKAGEELGSLAARGKWAEMPQLITDEMLETFVIIGSWDDITEKLHAKYDGLLDRVGLYRPFVPGEEDAQWQKLIERLTR
ncbi:MAG: TIGR03617 family F420-dependent LLM class oxidoreductase [Chloroflexi bacterium]|nr:TIGR03617 family F420-dependent LLM class oxidoreductase [Chloroflexota bacterium]